MRITEVEHQEEHALKHLKVVSVKLDDLPGIIPLRLYHVCMCAVEPMGGGGCDPCPKGDSCPKGKAC